MTVWVMMLREGLRQKIHLLPLDHPHLLHQDHPQLGKHTPSELDFCCLCSQNWKVKGQEEEEVKDFKPKKDTPCSHWACSDGRGSACFPQRWQPFWVALVCEHSENLF